MGTLVLLYPTAAAWFSAVDQQHVVHDYQQNLADLYPDRETQFAQAHAYNDALSSGAELKPNTNVPVAENVSQYSGPPYSKLLNINSSGMMGRILIPSVNVDLPIYHGTSEHTLLRGAGHLEGTSLPVGGDSTHTVVTAHRGLSDATMFTDLQKVTIGDTFTFDILGEPLTYRVIHTQVVEPHESEHLRFQAGKDLATLVTCTPLGINTHRILVTGERVSPAPAADVARAEAPPEGPGFPWWVAVAVFGGVVAATYIWFTGRGKNLPPINTAENSEPLGI